MHGCLWTRRPDPIGGRDGAQYRTLTFQCRSVNRKTDNRTSAFLEEEVHDKDIWGCTAFSRCFKMQVLAHS
jgi:hypothetical protein